MHQLQLLGLDLFAAIIKLVHTHIEILAAAWNNRLQSHVIERFQCAPRRPYPACLCKSNNCNLPNTFPQTISQTISLRAECFQRPAAQLFSVFNRIICDLAVADQFGAHSFHQSHWVQSGSTCSSHGSVKQSTAIWTKFCKSGQMFLQICNIYMVLKNWTIIQW